LDKLVQAGTSVYNDRDLEKENKKDKLQKALIAAIQVTPLNQVQTCGPARGVDRMAIS
jgi:formiminotetrahydrofolate cyclodeaminase